MKFAQYGDPNGRLVVYFHGVPGAIEECMVFDDSAKRHNLRFICFDRFSLDADSQGNDYYLSIADAIQEQADDTAFDIVGFSLGCHVALKLSVLMRERVRQLHLVSAAAPLESGDYLDDMAGALVFKLAKNSPVAFAVLSYWQSLLCRLSPRFLYALIFASAQAEDKSLSEEPGFQATLQRTLEQSYVQNLKGYMRDVREYVQPWQGLLKRCEGQTVLWHGAQDNWAPVAMADLLAKELPHVIDVQMIDNASHYSCLLNSVEGICQKLHSDNE